MPKVPLINTDKYYVCDDNKKGGFMKYSLTILTAAFLSSCGAVDKGIEQYEKIQKIKKEEQAAKEAEEQKEKGSDKDDVRTGSRTTTTTTSVTETVSVSGDQSVFDEVKKDKEEDKKEPVVVVVKSPIVGVWLEDCDDGIAYKKVFGKDGILRITTLVYQDQYCESYAQAYTQHMRYAIDRDFLVIEKQAPIEITIIGDNNTLIMGESELHRH